jgi:hypothetical protein
MKRFAAVAALLLVLANRADAAEIQKSGAEQFPGKFMVGANPIGLQLGFTDYGAFAIGNNTIGVADRIIYKVNLQFAGLLKSFDKVSLWLGGELGIGGRGSLAVIEPGIFVQLTLEKLVTKFPLVPIIRAGVSGPIYVPYGFPGVSTAGAFQVKVGGGAYYFLTKNIGLGADTNFGFGPGFAKVNGNLNVGFAGYWDFLLGARFAF